VLLKHYAQAKIIIPTIITVFVVALASVVPQRPSYAQQPETCVVVATGQGWGPVTIVNPPGTTRLEGNVTWDGLQLRVYIDNTVYATSMYDNPYFSTPNFSSTPWYIVGQHQLEFGGIMINSIGTWEVRACGTYQPQTPTPTPTRTPIPWLVSTSIAYNCQTSDPTILQDLGAEYVATGSSVHIYYDQGASGDPGTIYEVIQPGQAYGVRYTQEMTLPLTPQALIRIVGGSGSGIPMVLIETTTCTIPNLIPTPIALVPTPLVVPHEDIKPVTVGAEYVGTDCYTIMPSVNIDISVPFASPFQYSYGGFGVCLRKHAISFRWGDYDLMAIVMPLLMFAFLWLVYNLFRRG